MRRIKRPRLLGLLTILAALLTAAWLLPLDRIIVDLQTWVAANPRWAYPAMLGLLVVGILLMLPASLMFMLCGFLFGLVNGALLVWAATLVASTCAFLIGRTLGRPWVSRRIERQVRFQALDRAIRRRGFFVVFLTRLILFLPFPALNYSHGLTSVRLRDYVAGTMLGMVPAIVLFVYLGTLASDINDILQGRVSLDGNQLAIAIGGTGLVIALIAWLVFAARKALGEEITQASME